MKSIVFYLFVITTVGIVSAARVAIAHFRSPEVNGSVVFTEVDEGIRVTGLITGLPAGSYGFHIHEFGDTITCDAAGAHFNPDGNSHGDRNDVIRHVGDLGNIQFVGKQRAVANIDFVDSVISLRDRNSVLGRTLVLHGQEDDLGRGDHETSLTTGNAGARVVCAVIGILTWDD